MLLWLWHRPVTTTPIQSLAWELPYAEGVVLKSKKAKRKEKTKKNTFNLRTVRFFFFFFFFEPQSDEENMQLSTPCLVLIFCCESLAESGSEERGHTRKE